MHDDMTVPDGAQALAEYMEGVRLTAMALGEHPDLAAAQVKEAAAALLDAEVVWLARRDWELPAAMILPETVVADDGEGFRARPADRRDLLRLLTTVLQDDSRLVTAVRPELFRVWCELH
jgi:hypothetical protein